MVTNSDIPSASKEVEIESKFKDIEVQFNARASELNSLQLDPQEIEKQVSAANGLLNDAQNINGALGLSIATKALTIFSSYVEAQKNALIDGLTGLLNRNGVYAAGKARLAHCERNNDSMAIFFLDLNKFKPINDTLGHKDGDEALKLVAQSMKQWFRAEDILARPGGDEFIIIMTNKDPNHSFDQELHKVEILYNENIVHMGSDSNNYPIGASVGMTKVAEGETIEAAIARADKLMYIAKKQSKRATLNQSTPSVTQDLSKD